ncbi:MAG: hypothetical protein PWP27_1076 [Clostridiales bacterium]|jgi:type III secretory pathway component EscV|nr:hypothetical protein [Clostridiales bacterium]MDK2933266.1 hypothetical protein [Clostridiales bacterium]
MGFIFIGAGFIGLLLSSVLLMINQNFNKFLLITIILLSIILSGLGFTMEVINQNNIQTSADANNKTTAADKKEAIEKSNQAFQDAVEFVNNKNYAEALNKYTEVIEEDKDHFNIAQEKIKELQDRLFSDYFEQAQKAYNNQNYIEAISKIDLALNIKQDAEARELKNKCESAQKMQKEQREAEMMQNITKKYDDVENITWYSANGDHKSIDNFAFQAYIGQKDKYVLLRLFTGFHLEDWLFTRTIKVKTDSKAFDIPFDSLRDVQEKIAIGGIYEWVDIPASPELIDDLKSITHSKEVKIRFSGKEYYKDFILSDTQKKRLQYILDYYDYLKKSTQ